jgi:hypothetical protein
MTNATTPQKLPVIAAAASPKTIWRLMKNGALATLLAFGLCRPAAADFSGESLNKMCGSEEPEIKAACDLWISGFSAGLFASQASKKIGDETCLPNGVTGAHAGEIVKKFIEDNPQQLQFGAEVIALTALKQAFPCAPPKQAKAKPAERRAVNSASRANVPRRHLDQDASDAPEEGQPTFGYDNAATNGH